MNQQAERVRIEMLPKPWPLIRAVYYSKKAVLAVSDHVN